MRHWQGQTDIVKYIHQRIHKGFEFSRPYRKYNTFVEEVKIIIEIGVLIQTDRNRAIDQPASQFRTKFIHPNS